MDKIKCVIIEDEIPSAEELKCILSENDDIDVAGIAYDGESGYELIKTVKPDIVFMDIGIPVLNGLQLAKRLRETDGNIIIVFVTAYEQYALKAFEVEASDYILKPFDEKRIGATLGRLIENRKNAKRGETEVTNGIREILERMARAEGVSRKVPCELNDRIILVDVSEIYFCYIENELTYVKTFNKRYLTNFQLYELEKKTGFFRSHRSYLVNTNYIKELYPWFNGAYELVMNDEEKSKIPLSRSNVKRLKDMLGI